MESKQEQVHAIIRGKVQGVCYRAWTLEQAKTLALSGWVRNQANGSVELLATGPKPAILELIQACYQGPPAAKVESIDKSFNTITPPNMPKPPEFKIRYD